ncbi:MAG TPA: hypothetical protein PLD62_06595 [Candidatus Cloacimonadota bacterium]|nr:hypothetical protein [Candidatus Cloacimonadota bacterium]
MRLRISLIALIFIFANLAAEDGEENIFAIEEETFHANETSEILSAIRENPLEINSASREDLWQLPWLSEDDIDLILSFRKEKKIRSEQDLASCGIDPITISEIAEYIAYGKKYHLKFENRLRLEYNEAKENMPSTAKYFQRTELQYSHFRSGFISQKDEGESDLLDYNSYFLQYTGNGVLENLVLGKYRAAMGQGIVFAPKLGMSKSAEATSVPIKRYRQIKPYTSSYEIWDFRGAGAELKLHRFRLIPYFSANKLSANLDSAKAITSFNETGFHAEDDDKNNVQETVFGSAWQYETAHHEIGINFASFAFDHDFANGNADKYTALNAFFVVNKTGFPIFGEVACIDGNYGMVAGAKFGENKFRQLVVTRYYEKDIPSWHGNPFASQSSFNNEMGMYYGVTILPAERHKINAYFDVWSFPQTRYFEKMPTVGSEQFLQWEVHFASHSLRMTLQHKFKEKYITLDEAKIRNYERTLCRLDWWQKFTALTLKTRAEFVNEYLSEDKVYASGFLLYEQLKLQREYFELIAQITCFKSDTKPFKVKHYVYENNVDGIMQNSVFSGDGVASYLLIRFNFSEKFSLQTKISDTWQEAGKMRFFCQFISKF